MTTVVGPVKAPVGLTGGVLAAYGITAAAVISSGPSTLCTLACQVAGSIVLNDNNSTSSGNSIANQIFSGSMSVGQILELNWPCATGITASVVTTGTFSTTFS
jgi:hypothetical protein